MKGNDIRKGAVIMYNNQPHRVIDFRHHTPGNLRAMVQTKLRNVLNGNQTEVRFSSTEEIAEADFLSVPAVYLYADSDGFHFMKDSDYEQIPLSKEVLADAIYYLQDQMKVNLSLYEGNPIGVELPASVILTIVETEPEIRGSTASNSPKPAKTDTGLQVTVPSFVKVGERISVSTADGSYLSRAE